MGSKDRKGVYFVLGLILGGILGVIAGYVINDLTSRENPEVVRQMEESRQEQENIDDLLEQIGSQPPANADSATDDAASQP